MAEKLQFLGFVSPVSDAGLKELGKLDQLQTLTLTNSLVTDAGMKELKSLKNLEMLSLNQTKVTARG